MRCFMYPTGPTDYTSLSQTIILDSIIISVSVMIDIADDVIFETDERFLITLISLNENCVATSSPVSVFIIDDDGKFSGQLQICIL